MAASEFNTASGGSDAALSHLLSFSRSPLENGFDGETFTALRKELAALFHCNGASVFILDKDRVEYGDMEEISSRSQQPSADPQLPVISAPYKGSELEIIMEQLESRHQPMIINWENAFKCERPSLLKFIKDKDNSVRESMVAVLKCGSKVYGTFWLHSVQLNHFNQNQFTLFGALANQLAPVIGHRIAYYELVEKQREKDILLAISEKIAKADEPDQLLQIILNEVKPIFGFYDTGILVIDEAAKGYYDLSVIYPHIDRSDFNQYLKSKGYFKDNAVLPLTNSVVSWIINSFDTSNVPIMVDYTQDFSAYSDHELLEDIKAGGFTVGWICPLIRQGKPFGLLSLNFTKEMVIPFEKQALFMALADRVGSALANVMATAEIIEREKEKEKLLNISEAMASVQTGKQLLRVIYEKIKDLLPYDSAGLYILDKDNATWYEMTDDEVLPDRVQTEIAKANLLGPFTNDGLTEDFWFNYTEPAITTIREQLNFAKDNPGRLQLEIGIANGLQQMLCGPLSFGGKKLGMLCFISKKENFYTKEKHTRIFKSVADLTAIAVAGILTNRELVEREKEKDLLYKIASTIANVKNRVSLMKLIFEELKNIFQFYDVGLLVFDKDRTTGTDWSTLSPEISPSDANHAIHSHQFYKLPVKGSLFEKLAKQVEHNGEPIIVKFNQQLQEENPYLKNLLELELKFGYKEALFTTLKYGN